MLASAYFAMNKRKILKLLGGLSSGAVLLTTSSVLLTSCSNKNTDSNFTNGLAKSLDIRFLPSSRVPYPIYATPARNPYFMAPNFKVMNIINGTPLAEEVVIDPNTGWPTEPTLRYMTYQQFFMNDLVAREMAPTGSEKESIGQDFTALAKKRHDSGLDDDHILKLKGAYKNDDYADETIKAFNCPYFYKAYNIGTTENPSYASVYSTIRSIDLSENNLWYLPFFGYNSSPQDPTDPNSPYIMRSQQPAEGNPANIGFINLGLDKENKPMTTTVINLQENQLTLLPYADIVIDGEDVTYDLTNLFTDSTNTWSNVIDIDDNCFGYDLKDTGLLSSFAKYRKYNELGTIEFNKDANGKGYQSYAFYTNRATIYDQVVWKCCEKLNETEKQFKKHSLSSHIPEVQELSKVLGHSEYKCTLGECLNQLIAEYLSDNGLCSAYLYTNYEISLALLVQAFSNADYMYDYASYSTNSGCLTFSIQLGTPRLCIRENDAYINSYAVGQGSYFITFTIYGFEATEYMVIIISVLGVIIAVALIVVILYYTWIRKRIAAKRKLKDIEKISSIEKKSKKGGKK